MSYIIWKNKNSDDIKGLLIRELPPITKPKRRTSTIEIDGRDGDIINYLGYKSYTKTIPIGLTRNYDLDEIMHYFNGSGNLILSNEPDKYYIAEIIDSIDYDKLLNFKLANIKFHVQPFKYLVNEAPFVLNITNEQSIKVSNLGYEESKPIITLYGSGTVQIKINGLDVFSVNIDDDYITIDSIEEDAYYGNTLKNRKMTGIFPILKSGINIISWTGNLTKIEVQPKSRWL